MNIWEKYEKANNYMQEKGLVTKTEKAWKYYIGDQWGDLKDDNLPVMNVIKPIIKFKVSTVCQHSMVAKYSDARGRADQEGIFSILDQKFNQSWEKAKMNNLNWKVVKSAAVQGDSYALFNTASTLDEPQILLNTEVLLGDENTKEIQEQPYIMIRERWSVERAKRIAKENGVKKNDYEKIASDTDTVEEVMNHKEVEDKVTVILYMDKDEDGVVRIARVTRACDIEPIRRIESTRNDEVIASLRTYPIVNFIWEEKPNDARGASEVTLLIPNQVSINKTLARREVTSKMCSYPRIIYDVAAVENPDDLMRVGSAIGVQTGDARSVSQAVAYLRGESMSPDAAVLYNDLVSQTKELNGASDFAMGNINPQRTAASAVIAIRDQSQVALNEQVAEFTQYIEDVALLWFDMWCVFEDEEEFGADYETLLSLKPSVRIDVSQDNAWTKQAEQQAFDSLLNQKLITFEMYAKNAPENGAIPKSKLTAMVEQMQQPEEMPEEMAQIPMDEAAY